MNSVAKPLELSSQCSHAGQSHFSGGSRLGRAFETGPIEWMVACRCQLKGARGADGGIAESDRWNLERLLVGGVVEPAPGHRATHLPHLHQAPRRDAGTGGA